MNASIQQLFERIRLLKASDFYKTRSLTPEQLGWLQSICDQYISAASEDRRSIEALVTPEISFLFGMYGTAMAVESVRVKDQEKIFWGLVAMAIENQIPDWRDSMYVMVMLHHSAIKIGANPSMLFQRAAEMASTRSARFFQDFVARTPQSRDIGIFGMKEGTDSEGNFNYVAK